MSEKGRFTLATVRIRDEDYVIVPRKQMEEMGLLAPGDFVEAIPFMIQSIARDLRAARNHAGLTQVELAKRLKKSQAMVSAAETGRVSVGERYVKSVLRCCGLPPDWPGPAPRPRRAAKR